IIQLLYFFSSGLLEQEVIRQANYLPILDRSVILLTFVWLGWLWVFPENNRIIDAIVVFINLIIGIYCLINIYSLGTVSEPIHSYNISDQALIYNIAGIIILSLNFILIFARKKENWEIGIIFFLMLLVGLIFDTFFPDVESNYSGVVRLFMLAAFPLLFSLTSRVNVISYSDPALVPTEDAGLKNKIGNIESNRNGSDRRKYTTDPVTMQSLFLLASETDITKINMLLAKSISQSLLIDLCFLIYADDTSDNLYISGGYDLIKEEPIEGGNIKKENFPTITNLIKSNLSSSINLVNASIDIKGLEELLGIPNVGSSLFIPIQADNRAVGGILLLSPYSFREWEADEQNFLQKISSSIAPIILRGQSNKNKTIENGLIKEKLDDQIEKANSLEILNDDLELQLIELKESVINIENKLAAANEIISSKKVEALDIPVNSKKSDYPELNEQNERIIQLETELQNIQNEYDELKNRVTKKSISGISEINEVRTSINDQIDVIVSISQELRQPMSSIIGYADLLLGESIGTLGALQRKFIERIRTSTERLGSLTDDLIQLNLIDNNQIKKNIEASDLNLIIDNAMTFTSSQMREKNIALRLDIPESFQTLFIDKEAVQQILIHLLQNAGSSSPVEGSVTIRVRKETESGVDHIIMQVSDTGGGIPESEVRRIFSRFYRAEYPLVPGIGDKGVGLSIARSLTEAQGGSISVETEIGVGSTFIVKIPISKDQVMTPNLGVN
ncbi:MAG: ATP-binding protein, partial [Chloroflexota bacterium]